VETIVESEAALRSSLRVALKKRHLIALFMGILALGGYGSWLYFGYHRPHAAFRSLLSGSDRVQISYLLIKGQDKEILIDDPNLTKYLTDAFRLASRNYSGGGITYTADIHLSSGGSVRCALYVPREDGLITISFPEEYYYRVTLPEPIPESLAKLLSELR
jgi:hypothetical protein